MESGFSPRGIPGYRVGGFVSRSIIGILTDRILVSYQCDVLRGFLREHGVLTPSRASTLGKPKLTTVFNGLMRS